jgi:predicted nucleotidyltransferase
MALSKDRLDGIIAGFISKLESEIPVEEVILFGSYAHGNAKEHSDIDLAIISDWFQDKKHIENMQYLSRVLPSTHKDNFPILLSTKSEFLSFFDRPSFSANRGDGQDIMHFFICPGLVLRFANTVPYFSNHFIRFCSLHSARALRV